MTPPSALEEAKADADALRAELSQLKAEMTPPSALEEAKADADALAAEGGDDTAERAQGGWMHFGRSFRS